MHQTAYEVTKGWAKDRLVPLPAPLLIADVGSCDVNGSVREVFERPGWTYRGLDMQDGPNVDQVLSSLYSWPEILDGTFDVAITISTLEHVPKPWIWMREVVRVVKPGGIVYVNAPNTWPYHLHPVDCWRIWPDGLRAIFEECGVETREAQTCGFDTWGWGVRR